MTFKYAQQQLQPNKSRARARARKMKRARGVDPRAKPLSFVNQTNGLVRMFTAKNLAPARLRILSHMDDSSIWSLSRTFPRVIIDDLYHGADKPEMKKIDQLRKEFHNLVYDGPGKQYHNGFFALSGALADWSPSNAKLVDELLDATIALSNTGYRFSWVPILSAAFRGRIPNPVMERVWNELFDSDCVARIVDKFIKCDGFCDDGLHCIRTNACALDAMWNRIVLPYANKDGMPDAAAYVFQYFGDDCEDSPASNLWWWNRRLLSMAATGGTKQQKMSWRKHVKTPYEMYIFAFRRRLTPAVWELWADLDDRDRQAITKEFNGWREMDGLDDDGQWHEDASDMRLLDHVTKVFGRMRAFDARDLMDYIYEFEREDMGEWFCTTMFPALFASTGNEFVACMKTSLHKGYKWFFSAGWACQRQMIEANVAQERMHDAVVHATNGEHRQTAQRTAEFVANTWTTYAASIRSALPKVGTRENTNND